MGSWTAGGRPLPFTPNPARHDVAPAGTQDLVNGLADVVKALAGLASDRKDHIEELQRRVDELSEIVRRDRGLKERGQQ